MERWWIQRPWRKAKIAQTTTRSIFKYLSQNSYLPVLPLSEWRCIAGSIKLNANAKLKIILIQGITLIDFIIRIIKVHANFMTSADCQVKYLSKQQNKLAFRHTPCLGKRIWILQNRSDSLSGLCSGNATSFSNFFPREKMFFFSLSLCV